MNVLIEHSLRKLSTGEVDVTNGQTSGKQKWDVGSEVQPHWVGARAICTLAEILPGRAVVRMIHCLSLSISSIVSWPSVFPNTVMEEDRLRSRETKNAL